MAALRVGPGNSRSHHSCEPRFSAIWILPAQLAESWSNSSWQSVCIEQDPWQPGTTTRSLGIISSCCGHRPCACLASSPLKLPRSADSPSSRDAPGISEDADAPPEPFGCTPRTITRRHRLAHSSRSVTRSGRFPGEKTAISKSSADPCKECNDHDHHDHDHRGRNVRVVSLKPGQSITGVFSGSGPEIAICSPQQGRIVTAYTLYTLLLDVGQPPETVVLIVDERFLSENGALAALMLGREVTIGADAQRDSRSFPIIRLYQECLCPPNIQTKCT